MSEATYQMTDTELDFLIDSIPPKELKKYYQKNPREFSKIIKGFRPEAMTDEMAISLAKKNKSKSFIQTFIYKRAQIWISEINGYKKSLEDKGVSSDAALFRVLPLSVFSKDIDLFFKFEKISYTEEYISDLKTALKRYGITADLETDRDDSMLLKEQNEKLTTENHKLEQEISAIKNEAEEKNAILMNEKSRIEIQLNDFKEAYENEKSNSSELKLALAKTQYLSKYIDEEKEYEKPDDDFPYVSVCQVIKDSYSDQLWLYRLADIKAGKIEKFTHVEGSSMYFENRERLYLKDGPQDIGMVGVWRWNAIPNKNDPTTDYVITSYCTNIKVIEIIEISTANSCKEIIDTISDGIFIQTDNHKMFFAFRDVEGNLKGVLCPQEKMEYANGTAKLKRDVVSLPQYIIQANNVIRLADKMFCRQTSLGMPQSMCKTKDPLEVAKELVMSRATIAYLRQQGLNRKEAQTYQQALKGITTKTIYDEFADAYMCSTEEAKKYINEFVTRADEYLNEGDLDTDILASAMKRNPDLIKKGKEYLREEWESENSEMLNTANGQLEKINAAIQKKKEEMEEIELKNSKTQKINDEKQLVLEETERRLDEKIASIPKSVASLISDSVFYSSLLNKVRFGDDCVRYGESVNGQNNIGIEKREIKLSSELSDEEIDDLDVFCDELADNLMNIGYSNESVISLSHIITYCLAHKMPIVCSSNGENIAECVAAMFGCEGPGIINVPMETTYGTVAYREVCKGNANNNVFYVTGLFDGLTNNTFNTVMCGKNQWKEHTLLILSVEGIDIENLPLNIWNRAIFLDGDMGLYRQPIRKLTSFQCKMALNEWAFEKHQAIKPSTVKNSFSFVSNIAALNYAEFMDEFGEDLKSAWVMLLQIAITARATDNEEVFKKDIQKLDIDANTEKMLEIYL